MSVQTPLTKDEIVTAFLAGISINDIAIRQVWPQRRVELVLREAMTGLTKLVVGLTPEMQALRKGVE